MELPSNTPDLPVIGDQLRVCGGCGHIRHHTHFPPGRKYCRVCKGAFDAMRDHGIKTGLYSLEEMTKLLQQSEWAEPLRPDAQIYMTVADDEPPPTTEELNAMLETPEHRDDQWLAAWEMFQSEYQEDSSGPT